MSTKRAAVLAADGFEEGEALVTIDLLRRCGIEVDSISITEDPRVRGAHGVVTVTDKIISEVDRDTYDALVIPGGLPGATNLRDDDAVISWVRKFYEEGKQVAAICAGPIVFHRAGITRGKRVTSYPAEEFKNLFSDATYVEDELVVTDGNITTSRGPATVFEFAFRIAELLGADTAPEREGTLYTLLLQAIKDEA